MDKYHGVKRYWDRDFDYKATMNSRDNHGQASISYLLFTGFQPAENCLVGADGKSHGYVEEVFPALDR